MTSRLRALPLHLSIVVLALGAGVSVASAQNVPHRITCKCDGKLKPEYKAECPSAEVTSPGFGTMRRRGGIEVPLDATQAQIDRAASGPCSRMLRKKGCNTGQCKFSVTIEAGYVPSAKGIHERKGPRNFKKQLARQAVDLHRLKDPNKDWNQNTFAVVQVVYKEGGKSKTVTAGGPNRGGFPLTQDQKNSLEVLGYIEGERAAYKSGQTPKAKADREHAEQIALETALQASSTTEDVKIKTIRVAASRPICKKCQSYLEAQARELGARLEYMSPILAE